MLEAGQGGDHQAGDEPGVTVSPLCSWGGTREWIVPTCKVLDLADESGAFCSRILADMGMDVVKFELRSGHSSRRHGPFPGNKPNQENSLT